MVDLIEGCFFGEFQVLFDLYSGFYYRSSENQRNQTEVVLLTIDKEVFLNTITKEENHRSFKHYFDMAIKKYRYYGRMQELNKQEWEIEEDDYILRGMDKKYCSKIKLFTIIEIQQYFLGQQSASINEYFKEIFEKRENKNGKKT